MRQRPSVSLLLNNSLSPKIPSSGSKPRGRRCLAALCGTAGSRAMGHSQPRRNSRSPPNLQGLQQGPWRACDQKQPLSMLVPGEGRLWGQRVKQFPSSVLGREISFALAYYFLRFYYYNFSPFSFMSGGLRHCPSFKCG